MMHVAVADRCQEEHKIGVCAIDVVEWWDLNPWPLAPKAAADCARWCG